MEQGSNVCTLKVAYIKDGFVPMCSCFPEPMLFFHLEILPIFRIFHFQDFLCLFGFLDLWQMQGDLGSRADRLLYIPDTPTI